LLRRPRRRSWRTPSRIWRTSLERIDPDAFMTASSASIGAHEHAYQVRAIASRVSMNLADLSNNHRHRRAWLNGLAGTANVMPTYPHSRLVLPGWEMVAWNRSTTLLWRSASCSPSSAVSNRRILVVPFLNSFGIASRRRFRSRSGPSRGVPPVEICSRICSCRRTSIPR